MGLIFKMFIAVLFAVTLCVVTESALLTFLVNGNGTEIKNHTVTPIGPIGDPTENRNKSGIRSCIFDETCKVQVLKFGSLTEVLLERKADCECPRHLICFQDRIFHGQIVGYKCSTNHLLD